MHFAAIAETDIGISRNTNQDSLLIKHAECSLGEVLLAVVCDGMGGWSKGEVASAAAVHAISGWFENELPNELEEPDMRLIGNKCAALLNNLNTKIYQYGRRNNINLGTTFTGILFINDKYVIVHVGDCRVYHMAAEIKQLTTDHTFVAREIKRGTMTLEQAENDKRRNMLLQCIGDAQDIEPEVIVGNCEKGVYMLCSDGFRHKITEEEMYKKLNPAKLKGKKKMSLAAQALIKKVKKRKETDNISVLLIKAE